MGKRKLITLLNLSSWCLVMVERLFLAVPRGCLQFAIVVFPDHTHLLFFSDKSYIFPIYLFIYLFFFFLPFYFSLLFLKKVLLSLLFHSKISFTRFKYSNFSSLPSITGVFYMILGIFQ